MMTSHGLVLWGERAGTPYAVGLIDPITGEIADTSNPASVAAWYLAYRDYIDAICRPAEAAALELLNAHLDAAAVSKLQLDLPGGHVVEIAGESKGAADGAVHVEDAEALRRDLDVLVDRGDLSGTAADAAVKVSTVTTYKADLRRVKTLAARADVVGETVRDHLQPAPRERKRPTVRRIA
jgi:hypothetical protein